MQTAPAIIQQTLPGLVQRAATQLASATSAAEVLEARDTARVAYDAAKSAARFVKAKKAHDDVLAAVYRAQADALEIEALAKRRLADEYDAAQDRGEVAVRGTLDLPKWKVWPRRPTSACTHKDIHEAREIRDAEEADPGIVRRTIDEQIDAGHEPTRTAIKRAVRPSAKRHERRREATRKTASGMARGKPRRAPAFPHRSLRKAVVSRSGYDGSTTGSSFVGAGKLRARSGASAVRHSFAS
jgi:hypothetical protein